MHQPAITGHGVFTPPEVITNDELVATFNTYADRWNAEHADAVASSEMQAIAHSSSDVIVAASGIERRHVLDKSGILDPEVMHPWLRERTDDEPGQMAEMALAACRAALGMGGLDAGDVDLVICAASNHERAYPAIAVEIQNLLGAGGFAFDMNVACSSATFGIQAAADMIRAGSATRALVVSPEICSAHLEWRDRDCHFIFGDVATAVLIERTDLAKGPHFLIRSTRCATQFSNNIRNNDGFLRRTRKGHMEDHRDMQFMQNGRKVLGRAPAPGEQPNILQDYANTSSAGSIIAFSKAFRRPDPRRSRPHLLLRRGLFRGLGDRRANLNLSPAGLAPRPPLRQKRAYGKALFPLLHHERGQIDPASAGLL